MLIGMASEHQIVANEMNQNRLADPYTSPFNNRPSILSNPQIQHQSYNTIVNPELPLQSPNAFQISPAVAQYQPFATQTHGFVPSNGEPWQCPVWMTPSNMQTGSYINFIGQQQTRTPFKRKATPDMDADIKSKQLITDEKMAAHLEGMHISSNYTAHETSNITDAPNKMEEMNDAEFLAYPCSRQEIEEKLRRAQRITVSDVVGKIENEPLLPAAILERLEKPCKALVVWQPPQRLTDLIISNKAEEEAEEKDAEESVDDCSAIEIETNDAEMDLDF